MRDVAADEATFAPNLFEIPGVRGAIGVCARSATAAMIPVPVSGAVTWVLGAQFSHHPIPCHLHPSLHADRMLQRGQCRRAAPC